ncbi:hypothetical protein MST22_04860 [Virgibacillus halodenitrificans]|nr:hypothetical protein [Virgibacillus halodenitrificans]
MTLGKHEQFDDLGTGKQPLDLLKIQLDGLEIPILAEFDPCHTLPMPPLVIGKKVKLGTGRKKLLCMENWLDFSTCIEN